MDVGTADNWVAVIRSDHCVRKFRKLTHFSCNSELIYCDSTRSPYLVTLTTLCKPPANLCSLLTVFSDVDTMIGMMAWYDTLLTDFRDREEPEHWKWLLQSSKYRCEWLAMLHECVASAIDAQMLPLSESPLCLLQILHKLPSLKSVIAQWLGNLAPYRILQQCCEFSSQWRSFVLPYSDGRTWWWQGGLPMTWWWQWHHGNGIMIIMYMASALSSSHLLSQWKSGLLNIFGRPVFS